MTATDPSTTRATTGRGRVVIVDDHPLLAYGLARALEQNGFGVTTVNPSSADDVVAAVATAADASRRSSSQSDADSKPVLVMVDLDLPLPGGGCGVVAAVTGMALDPAPRAAVLTGSADRLAWARCIEAGAVAVVSKGEPLEIIVDRIARLAAGDDIGDRQRAELCRERHRHHRQRRDALAGFDELSPRESEVLHGLMSGLNPKELAERDCVSIDTVRTQVKSVLRKLGVSSQLAAVSRAFTAGWPESMTER